MYNANLVVSAKIIVIDSISESQSESESESDTDKESERERERERERARLTVRARGSTATESESMKCESGCEKKVKRIIYEKQNIDFFENHY